MSWCYWAAGYVAILKPGQILLTNYNYFIPQHYSILNYDWSKGVDYIIVTIVATLTETCVLDTVISLCFDPHHTTPALIIFLVHHTQLCFTLDISFLKDSIKAKH